MRELTANEVDFVDGGNVFLIALGMAGAMFYFGYQAGKDMAERDNARSAS